MPTLKITGALVWLGSGKRWQDIEVLCKDGVIAEVAKAIPAQADQTIEAEGKRLIPGAIDAQVHFREPGNVYKEDLHTGSMACAAGGVTSFFEMPNTSPPATTPELIEQKKALAAEKSLVNYAFFIGATNDNIADLNAAKGVCGIKIFMGASTGSLLVFEQNALERIFANTDPERVIALHCEDELRIRERTLAFKERTDFAAHSIVRDNEAAALATRRAIDLAQRHKHRAHILHVSTAEECELFKTRGEFVTAECAPHHMMFSTQDYPRLKGRLKMNPSIKSEADCAALWQALKDGRIDMIATDHAPHTLEEKAKPSVWDVPAGVPAVENSLGLMLDAAHKGQCTLEQVIEWMCEAPARVFKAPRKGLIAPGYDADLVLIDLERQHAIVDERQFTKVRWSPWHGKVCTGWPVTTIVLGQVVFEEGRPNLAARGKNVF